MARQTSLVVDIGHENTVGKCLKTISTPFHLFSFEIYRDISSFFSFLPVVSLSLLLFYMGYLYSASKVEHVVPLFYFYLLFYRTFFRVNDRV